MSWRLSAAYKVPQAHIVAGFWSVLEFNLCIKTPRLQVALFTQQRHHVGAPTLNERPFFEDALFQAQAAADPKETRLDRHPIAVDGRVFRQERSEEHTSELQSH